MKIGLVLSGGVAKGAYQAGFLKALREVQNIEVSCISCASIGIFSGYAYSADKLDKLWEIWQNIHFDSVADLTFNVFFKHYLKNVMRELICEEDDLKLPVYIPVCYLPIPHMQYNKLQGKYRKKWFSFIRGAVCFPVVSGGLRLHRGQLAIDGGLMDNIPIQPLLYAEKPDLILVLHFEAGFKPRRRYLNMGIPIIDYDISLNNQFKKNSFNFRGDLLKSMLVSGYEYGKEICQQLFNDGNNDLETILAEAKKREEEELPLRIGHRTFDTLVQRANEVFYPFIRKQGNIVYDLSDRKRKKLVFERPENDVDSPKKKKKKKKDKKVKKEKEVRQPKPEKIKYNKRG